MAELRDVSSTAHCRMGNWKPETDTGYKEAWRTEGHEFSGGVGGGRKEGKRIQALGGNWKGAGRRGCSRHRGHYKGLGGAGKRESPSCPPLQREGMKCKLQSWTDMETEGGRGFQTHSIRALFSSLCSCRWPHTVFLPVSASSLPESAGTHHHGRSPQRAPEFS